MGISAEDPVYRLNVVQVYLPAAAQSTRGYSRLIDYFLENTTRVNDRRRRRISRTCSTFSCAYPWPGECAASWRTARRAGRWCSSNTGFTPAAAERRMFAGAAGGRTTRESDRDPGAALADQAISDYEMREGR